MRLTNLSKKNTLINRPTMLVDWQKQIGVTTISVRPGQELVYFFIQGLGNVQTRDIMIRLAERSSVVVYGLVIGSKHMHLHDNLSVIHEGRKSHSAVHIRSAFTDHSQGIINGTIHIKPKAQLANARLDERVLLLSSETHAETIPNLEIEAHDVIASHAATVSKISEEEIFYLQTRGLSRDISVRTIVTAFLHNQLTPLPESPIRARLEAILHKTLESIKI